VTTLYSKALASFAHQPIVTIACGTTCAYLGDERNLREFLVADEVAKHLHRAGHTVISLLIDDSLDPLSFRQLRVAVNKDPEMIERCRDWCGKPIGLLPDPWGCCESFADHFEQQLMQRLHVLNCHPTLVRAAKLYERGVYAPYVREVLQRSNEIMRFLHEHFQGYQPEKLFWALCPKCGYIDETQVTNVDQHSVRIHCARCNQMLQVGFDDLQGKLNWKLDCAVRWVIFNIDAEPFSKAYLEPQTGSFVVAQALSQKFFGGHQVMPLHYGLVKMEHALGLKLLAALPAKILRTILVEHPAADLTLTHDLVVTAASRHEVLPGVTYLDFVKQVLPTWLLTPDTLTPEQRTLVSHGIAFKKHFLNTEARVHLPQREYLDGEQPGVLAAIQTLLEQIIELRERVGPCGDAFHVEATQLLNTLGKQKGAVLRRLRLLVGQAQGVPATRFLFILPLEYLRMLAYIVELHLGNEVPTFLETA
jgi:hypothetical protein